MNRKLVRPIHGRTIGGVAAGLANYLGLPVILVRLIWIFLLLPGGLPGILPYLLLWVLIPAEKDSSPITRIEVQNDPMGGSASVQPSPAEPEQPSRQTTDQSPSVR